MGPVITISPFRCRMWDLHDRLESQLTEQTCRAVIDSIARHGQLVPVLGRRLANDPEHELELIFGARRLFATRHLNVPLQVEVREMTDAGAIVAMDVENRLRKDISPYERGTSYARWLRAGYFKSQDDIARVLRISSSQVSRLLRVAQLPTAITEAFGSPSVIYEAWGLKLMQALDDPQRRPLILQRAHQIAHSQRKPTPREIFAELLMTSGSGRPARRAREDVIRGKDGKPLFRLRTLRGAVILELPVDRVTSGLVRSLARELARLLCVEDPDNAPANAEPADLPEQPSTAQHSEETGTALPKQACGAGP